MIRKRKIQIIHCVIKRDGILIRPKVKSNHTNAKRRHYLNPFTVDLGRTHEYTKEHEHLLFNEVGTFVY